MMTMVILFGLSAGWAQAQDIKINTRPLTPQEVKTYGLDLSTQIANGTHVVGVGQPVYLELLVEKGTVVTETAWSLDGVVDEDGDPLTSSAVITNSPIDLSVPIYDTIDRLNFDVASRMVIYPDEKGTYQISAQAITSTDTLNASIDVVGSVFVGKDHYLCVLCHATKMPDFDATHHARAFKDQITGEGSDHFAAYCIKCHTTGYDSAPAAYNGGFDDVAADTGWTFPEMLSSNNWDDMPLELQQKSNIQCESCHGPADEHIQALGDVSKIAVSLSAGNCGQCHDALGHHVKNFEWGTALHAKTEVDRSGSCSACHTTKGFIDEYDPGINEVGDIIPTGGTANEGITCAACHDPHSPGNGAHQLRNIDSAELGNGDVITDGGDGLICMNCHKSRRDAEDYVYGRASKYFGPHHGPQSDLLAGANAIEYGQEMPSSAHMTAIDDTCATCHMQDTEGMTLPEYAAHQVGGHSYTLKFDDGTNDVVYLTQACASCHGEHEDFDFGSVDYNLDGVVEGVQTEIHHLLNELGMLLPPFGSTVVNMSDPIFNDDENYDSLALKRGGYNYLFIEEDGSHGVHNPKYASAILRASIDDLRGGIDIDRDGLVDSWEIDNFGDLTSQSGTDDYDMDGLNNMAEMKLGTNAMLADSDYDGFSDLVELQGNSDPLMAESVPNSDLILLPAAEIGYMPKGTGTLVSIQMASDLTDGVWTNVGEAQESTGNWIYELDSLRGTTNRFYRAIEE